MAVDTTNEEPPARSGAEFDALVRTVLAGDRDAYRQVITLSETRVRMLLAAILPDPSAIEDVAQEVYVTAFYKLREYRPGSEFLAWISAIARNLALNERRRWRRSKRFKENFEAQMEASLETQINHSADHLEGDAMVALRQCLDALGDQARSVTEDFYFKELTSEQIAQRHQRKSGWVRLVLFRARSVLADCLQTKGVVQDAEPT